ncbi:MAG: tRNA pseudouridine(38-40) synthase TruA, partial [Clostridiales bacterium]|nr:tRNA pseudouridine(38-40) synthase TruA [Clostridiales bacterium]
MRRVKLILEYDGANYAGWQRQINAIGVQQRLEEALFRLTGAPIGVTG